MHTWNYRDNRDKKQNYRVRRISIIAQPYQTVQLKGITRLRLPTHLPLHPPHPLICTICDITVVVKKVAQNPAVLASYYR